jgi:hypothetical protein
MHPLDRTARIAGFLYLLVVITGFFTIMYAPGKLFVAGDAAVVANNILAHQSLLRADIAMGMFSELCFIATVLVLYRLLKETGPQLAALMVLLVLLDAPLAFAGIANELATLVFLRGADFLAAFDKPQRDALAIMLIHLNEQADTVSEIFWGLWLLPLGLLVYRSGFLPRFLGVWLVVNGFAYLALSGTELFLPEILKTISRIAVPVIFGEVAFTLWLLIVGARAPSSPAATT